MAKCYQCDRCKVVTILSKQDSDISDGYGSYNEPAMEIFTKDERYDICPRCANEIKTLIMEGIMVGSI